ncbi:MAG: Bug family tripartite tricarboxylate transporter substrate binding protein [Thermomicrobiales bacterium]
MSPIGKALSLALLTAFAAAGAPTSVCAQAKFPNKTVRIIVGFAAGGGTDIFARLVASKMFPDSGQAIVVENRVGGGGIIATESVARGPADGHTLLLVPFSTMVVNPAVYTRLPYDPIKDFIPISALSSYGYVMVANKTSGVKTVSDLVAYAKANPDKANFAGASAIYQLTNEVYKSVTGAPSQYITYKSTTDSALGIMRGEALMSIGDASPLIGPIQSGQIIGISVTSTKRMAALPNLPTMAEAGFPKLEMAGGNGIFVAANTPPNAVKALEEEIIRIVKLPDVRERFAALAAEPMGNTSAEFRELIKSELKRWTEVANVANIKIER